MSPHLRKSRFYISPEKNVLVTGLVSDSVAEPDPACHFDADPDLDPAVTLMRIRILPFTFMRIQKNLEKVLK
jgi:hypothetical protein